MRRLATIGVGSDTYLLVVVGTHYHAVPRAGVDAHGEHPNWSPRTVCGRSWHIVADPEGDPRPGWKPAVAPDCRACLRTLGVQPSE